MGSPLVAVAVEEPTQRSVLEHLLRGEGFEVTGHGEEASLYAVGRSRLLDAILLDTGLDGWGGDALPSWLEALHPRTPLVLLGRRSSGASVAEAVWERPCTYTAPLEPGPTLLLAVRRALEAARLDRRVRSLERAARGGGWGGLVGRSPEWRKLVDDLDRVAPTETTVLVRGEPGVGKRLVARALHAHSGRREGPFVPVDGAGLRNPRRPRGAGFTPERPAGPGGARPSWGERARSGTLYLSGIEGLDPRGQGALVEAAAQGLPAPGPRPDAVRDGFRLILGSGPPRESKAAEDVAEGLMEALGGVAIEVPPLRRRPGDIPLLVTHFASLDAPERPPPSLSGEALDRLFGHPWPGNVAELRAAVRRALASCGTEITSQDLPEGVLRGPGLEGRAPDEIDLLPPETLDLRALERWAIRRAVAASRGNLSEAAGLLGIGRTTLYRKLDAYGLR